MDEIFERIVEPLGFKVTRYAKNMTAAQSIRRAAWSEFSTGIEQVMQGLVGQATYEAMVAQGTDDTSEIDLAAISSDLDRRLVEVYLGDGEFDYDHAGSIEVDLVELYKLQREASYKAMGATDA